MLRNAPTRTSRAGFSLIEVLMATVVILTAMGAIFLVGSRCMGIIQSSNEVAAGSAALHERMQQLQATDWETLTDSESYADQVWTDPEDGTTENFTGLLKNATQSGSELRARGAVESVRISVYRPVANATAVPAPITVTRSGSTATVTSAASSLVDERMVRIDLRLTWNDGRSKVPRSQGLSTIVARR
jgi:prepilin-type N-terminal cleavage/methylation domain-containing protein